MSHPNVRSTIHRFGFTTNPFCPGSFRTSITTTRANHTAQNWTAAYAESANTLASRGAARLARSITSRAPSQSWTEAGVTTNPQTSPRVSTTRCRFRPRTFFPPVVPPVPAPVGRLHRLAVHPQGLRGRRGPGLDPDILPEVGASEDNPEAEAEEDLQRERDAQAEERGDEPIDRVLDEGGRILRDNSYGSVEEDVWRRDFTCNALYYNIEDFSLWDYVGAVDDLRARRLKLIGNAEQRYREDPVRMLRAARFEAKLGFTLEADTEAGIDTLRNQLTEVPAARLFDETLKLFLTGHGVRSLEVLRRRGLLGVLYPGVERYLARHPGSLVEQLLVAGLANTDERVLAGKSVTPTFLFTLLLYGPIAEYIEKQPQEKWADVGTILDGCDQALREVQQRVTIPKRFSLGVRDMFAMQPMLEHPRSRRVLRLIEQPRFRAGYDLLLLRAKVGMAPRELTDWWTALQAAHPAQRNEMVMALEAARGQRGGRAGEGAGEDSAEGNRPKRRRRRRRRPAGPE